MTITASTPPKLRLGLAAFGLAAVVAINALLAVDLYRQRQSALSDARHAAEIVVNGLEQYTARTLEAVDTSLQALAGRINQAHGDISLDHAEITELLRQGFHGPMVDKLMVINASGRWVNTGSGRPDRETTYEQADFFRTQQLMPDAGLYLDYPLMTDDNQAAMLAASRAILDDEDRFLGVVVAILDPAHYQGIYRDVSATLPGRLSLRDDQDRAIVTVGALEDERLPAENLLVTRPVTGYPLTQTMTVDTEQVLASWRSTLLAYAVLGGAISLLMLGALWLLWRESRRGERAQNRLHESESRFRSLIESTSDFVWEMDENGYCVYASPQVEDIMGYPPEEVVGMRPYDPMTPREQDRLTDIYHGIIESREPFHLLENRNVHKDGHEVVLETSGVPVFDEAGHFRGYRGIDRDITERKRLEEALRSLALLTGRESEMEFFQLANRNLARALGMRVAVLVHLTATDEALLKAWHDSQTGAEVPPLPTTIMDALKDRERLVFRDGLAEDLAGDPLATAIQARSLFATTIRPASGQRWGYLIALDSHPVSAVRLSRVEPILDVFSTRIALELDRNQAHADLSWEASHDTLTGLLNRRAFDEQLRTVLSQAPVGGLAHALIYMDLDQFKVVNDTCGHMAGDELLRQLARSLSARLRRSDQLARLGGDEFGLILADCPMERSMEIAETLLDCVRAFPFQWEGRNFSVGASIGMTHTREAVSEGNDLLAQADLACYAAKDMGRNRIQVYQADNLHIRARHGEMGWVPQLDRALVENRFQLFGQWITPVQADSRLTPSLEVLLRLRDEQGHIVPASEFIPAAERYNLMPRIDRHVIDRICVLAAGTPQEQRPRRWSINLSGTSLSDDSLGFFIESRFSHYGVDPAWFCFEITETAAIGNFQQAQQLFRYLRTLGCRVGLDDFGSGLSSFAYLREIEVDALKIDGSFVRGIADDRISRSMVRAMHQVGKAMELDTVAEFVETPEILAVLAELGVDMAQGFGIHRPQPLDALDPAPTQRQ